MGKTNIPRQVKTKSVDRLQIFVERIKQERISEAFDPKKKQWDVWY